MMNKDAARYAIYYAPPPESSWWRFACRWLGRDPISGSALEPLKIANVESEKLVAITAEPRRYGFHATLKAPFSLSRGTSPEDLYRFAAAFARTQSPIQLGALQLRNIDGFLAIEPQRALPRLSQFAQACVEQFDAMRAQISVADLARRRAEGLTPRQEQLLQRWGYPYVMQEWRFHMTLTGTLGARERAKLFPPLEKRVRHLNAEALSLDAICVFEQPARDLPFLLSRRFGFDGEVSVFRRTTVRGRLFYVIGASGAGKDSLLAYARRRLAGAAIVFAHRYITREHDAGGENHIALGDPEFEARARRGAFAMHWASNGHRYAIGTEIDHWLANGLDVVMNGSREYLDAARARYPGMTVVWVRASLVNLRARLSARARESAVAIEARVARAAHYAPPADAVVIDNDGPLEQAGEHLLRTIGVAANDPLRTPA